MRKEEKEKASEAINQMLTQIAKSVPVIARTYHEFKCAECPLKKKEKD